MTTPISSKAEAAKRQAQKARDELAATLDAIEDKFNVPKRATELGEKAAAAAPPIRNGTGLRRYDSRAVSPKAATRLGTFSLSSMASRVSASSSRARTARSFAAAVLLSMVLTCRLAFRFL